MLIDIVGWAGAVVTLGLFARGAWRVNKRLVAISLAVTELLPNGGSSLKDQVTGLCTDVRRLDDRVGKLENRKAISWRPW